MPFPIARWMSRFQRIEYGLSGFGLKNVMLCPRNVFTPRADPVGCWSPVGNGLSRVTAGRRLLVVAELSTVLLALNPGALIPCVPMADTNTPKPARITVPFPPGVQATPKRGLK